MTRLTHDEWAELERKAIQKRQPGEPLEPEFCRARRIPPWALLPCSEDSTEADFQARVVKLAKHFGWKHYHTHRSDKSPSGFPDLVLTRKRKLGAFDGRVLFRELKTNTGVVKPKQIDWLNELEKSGADAGVWRPAMWERIIEELT